MGGRWQKPAPGTLATDARGLARTVQTVGSGVDLTRRLPWELGYLRHDIPQSFYRAAECSEICFGDHQPVSAAVVTELAYLRVCR